MRRGLNLHLSCTWWTSCRRCSQSQTITEVTYNGVQVDVLSWIFPCGSTQRKVLWVTVGCADSLKNWCARFPNCNNVSCSLAHQTGWLVDPTVCQGVKSKRNKLASYPKVSEQHPYTFAYMRIPGIHVPTFMVHLCLKGLVDWLKMIHYENWLIVWSRKLSKHSGFLFLKCEALLLFSVFTSV